MIRMERGEEYILTTQDKWQLQVLDEAGFLLKDIEKEITRYTKFQEQEMQEAMVDAGVTTVNYDDKVYKAAGMSPPPLEQSPYITRLMQRNYEATLGEWENFTRTTVAASQQSYIKAMDKTYNLVASGAISYTQAFGEVIAEMASEGIKVIYASGHKDTLETATLRAIRTGIAQMSGDITDARMEEMDWDIALENGTLSKLCGLLNFVER